MLKLSKRITAAFLAGTMLLTMAVSSNATNNESINEYEMGKNGFYFLSDDVPETVTEYVNKYFLTFSVEELKCLGFSDKEIKGLEIGPAITSYEYNAATCDIYYFPVMFKDSIAAMLTAYKDETGEIAIQFGKSQLADSLNTLKTTSLKPYALISTEYGMYAISADNSLMDLEPICYSDTIDDSDCTIEMQPNSSLEETSKRNRFMLSEDHDLLADINAFYAQYPQNEPETKTSHLSAIEKTKPIISYNQVTKGKNNIVNLKPVIKYKSKTTKSSGVVTLNVPYVQNALNISGYEGGVCWAASTAAILIFWYKEMRNQDLGSGILVRNYLITNGSSLSSKTVGTEGWVEDVLDYYIPEANYSTHYFNVNNYEWPSVNTIKTNIGLKIPIYTRWDRELCYDESKDHATVICGYVLSGGNNSGIRGVYLMSPDTTPSNHITFVSYKTAYIFKGDTYSLECTIG